jgi:Leucine-rich repeat (LRR) protein
MINYSLDVLPNELYIHILSYLSLHEKLLMRLVSQKFNHLITQPSILWTEIDLSPYGLKVNSEVIEQLAKYAKHFLKSLKYNVEAIWRTYLPFMKNKEQLHDYYRRNGIQYISTFDIALGKKMNLKPIALYCPNFESIHLENCYLEDSLSHVITNCRKLKSIILYSCQPGTIFERLANCECLETFHLRFGGESFMSMFSVNELTNFGKKVGKTLKSLELSQTSELDDKKVSNLIKYCPNLVHLNLSGTQIGDATASYIAQCKNLKYLDLSLTNVSEVGISQIIKGCPNLEKVFLVSIRLNAEVTKSLAVKCKELQILNLEYAILTISDEDVAFLFKELKNLTALNIIGFPKLSLQNAKLMFDHMKQLEDLRLRNVMTDDESLEWIAKLPLKTLELTFCDVTGNGLKYLQNCKTIEHLILDGSYRTANIIQLIDELPNLKILDFDNDPEEDLVNFKELVIYIKEHKPHIQLSYETMAYFNSDDFEMEEEDVAQVIWL